ncbi:MAG: hypothetical protein JSS68_14950 [Actinobacteria bacterium]|nr:hypothetical protein [Actinomycetota bacterium]
MRTAHLLEYKGVVWLEIERDGSTFRTEPGWTGIFKCWKAKFYARRHRIKIEQPHRVYSLKAVS